MTEPTPGPAFYSIEKLLSQTVQPFPDLPPEEFEVLRESIRTRGLLNPVLLTADGYLFDGHQRLKAMIALGRKRLPAEQVRIMPKVDRDNMLAAAYASNLVRRMVTTAQKVACMHALVAKGWSQRKIAREFAMSQPAVSQLLANPNYLPEGELPEVIITQGEDGKTYTRTPRTPREHTDLPDSRYDRRQRIKRRLAGVRMSLTHALADAEACGQFDGFERDGIAEDIASIKSMLDRLNTTITPEP